MQKNSLIVSEVFYSIQGEGITTGIPAVFLRLAGCNLLCNGAGWRCDTIEVWQKGRTKTFEEVLPTPYIQVLSKGAHLVITGGEPMLHQLTIVDYLNWFRSEYKFTPIIEIETNGTITPGEQMLLKVDYWNVSPKLSSVNESYNQRVNEVALRAIKRDGRHVMYKFVISCEQDIIELLDDYGFIALEDMVFMPAGDTQRKLNDIREWLIEKCKDLQIRYCDRLHIVAWNKKTGV